MPHEPAGDLAPGIPKAKKVLEENGLPVTDENLFIVGALATKGGNKGLDFLKGNFKVSVPKKDPNKVAAPAPAPAPAAAPAAVAAPAARPAPAVSAPLGAPVAAGQQRTYRVSVGGNAYELQVEPM